MFSCIRKESTHLLRFGKTLHVGPFEPLPCDSGSDQLKSQYGKGSASIPKPRIHEATLQLKNQLLCTTGCKSLGFKRKVNMVLLRKLLTKLTAICSNHTQSPNHFMCNLFYKILHLAHFSRPIAPTLDLLGRN